MPQYNVQGYYAPLPGGVHISPRVAPVVFGLGLIEAVPENQSYALADPRDGDGSGLSGRVNVAWNECAGDPSSAASAGRPTTL